ncbi:MAG: mechanosensitive ion channel domain-containing protein [Alphaproteobacteria bacterium]
MRVRHATAISIVLALLLSLSAGSGKAAQQTPAVPAEPVGSKPGAPEPSAAAPAATKAAAPQPAAPAPPAGIELADIATQSTEVSNLLQGLTAAAAPSARIENISRAIPDLSKHLDAQVAETRLTLEAEPSLETLQTLQQEWQRRELEPTAWLSILTQRATTLQSGLNQLAELQKTWSSTRASAQASKAPDPILQQIESTLTAIAAAQAKLQSERTDVLDLQSRVAQEVTKCGTVLAQIDQHQQKAVAGIFVPDARPIWRVQFWADSLMALPDHVRKVSVAYWSAIVKYVRDPHEGDPLHAVAFVALALLFAAARRKIAAWEKSGETASLALSVFELPYAAALAMVLLIATSPFFQLSAPVRQVLTIAALAPMIRLARPIVRPSVLSAIYVLGFLFAIDTLRQAFAGLQVVDQAILVAETLAAIVTLIWLRRHYPQLIAARAESSTVILLRSARLLITIVLTVSLLAGATGYLRLARLLTPGVLVGGVLALAALVYLRVGAGIIALAFRVWPLRLLRMVDHHRELLARRIYVLLVWGAIGGWAARYLAYLGLLDQARALVQSVLTAKIERGTIAISLGGILEFFLTVWFAYLLSAFLRFLLEEDIYPRIGLGPGLSYAASSLLNYIILALGFVAGLGILGVDFSKVTILAGAFGVGIGFGLQSVVNNFVSGLILLFERPIHVGDMVQVGNLQGRVRRIGIRASIIRTMQGAEIIVPNANLITQEVTNWTLSDQLRRIDLPVGVSYGTAPKKVIELLEGVARGHPQVLENPAPRALFMGYGDSSINFELRVWAEYANWQQIHSDLTVALYDAVYAAGMSFPFPQREVRLLGDHQAGAATASPDAVKKK